MLKKENRVKRLASSLTFQQCYYPQSGSGHEKQPLNNFLLLVCSVLKEWLSIKQRERERTHKEAEKKITFFQRLLCELWNRLAAAVVEEANLLTVADTVAVLATRTSITGKDLHHLLRLMK